VILYEMLAGEVPFSGGKPQQVLVRHVIEKPKTHWRSATRYAAGTGQRSDARARKKS